MLKKNILQTKKKLTSFQIILLGFITIILAGTLILMLPISSKQNVFSPIIDCFFTATSAVCVTGLVVFDTASHWSIFGQVVILLMIQIGGFGIMMLTASFALLTGKKIGLFQRDAIKDELSAENIGGIVKYTSFVVKGIIVFELTGAVIMLPVFCKNFGAIGIFMAIFHSVSAFCNAGFDIMGEVSGQFSSISYFSSEPIINIVLILLIIIGGIGFMVWDDFKKNKFNLKQYRMQSKAILIMTLVLILVPFLFLFFFEYNYLPFGERVLSSLFQAVTPRTAGFSSQNISNMKETSQLLIIFLMLIGGAPGSTAGGMKVTTVFVIYATVMSVFRNKNNVEILKRRIEEKTIKNAITLAFLYFIIFLFSGIIISLIEKLPILACLFESASAIGTVGLTTGITKSLKIVSKLIIICLMFFGRVGGLTLIYATVGNDPNDVSKAPTGKITVG